MYYPYEIEIEPNTTSDAPKRVATGLNVGTLQKISVLFPAMCAGQVGVRIFHYEHILYPTNPNKWIVGNDVLIEFECDYIILEGKDDFKIEGYNLDDYYTHTPIVGFTVLPFSAFYVPGSEWLEA